MDDLVSALLGGKVQYASSDTVKVFYTKPKSEHSGTIYEALWPLTGGVFVAGVGVKSKASYIVEGIEVRVNGVDRGELLGDLDAQTVTLHGYQVEVTKNQSTIEVHIHKARAG
jgi:hypothetical protein